MPDEPRNPDDRPGNLHNNFFHACFSQPQAIRRLLAGLAPIVPVVFYHGVRPWSVAPAFQDMFEDLDGELRALTDQFRYVLIDAGHIDDGGLPQDPELRIRLAALKHAVRKDIFEVGLPLLARLLSKRPDMEVSLILRYILLQHPEIGRDDLDRVLLQHAPELKDVIGN